MDPNAPPELILERFDALLNAVTQHFSSEESILRDLGCPEHELEDHAADHQGLAAKALVLRQRLAIGQVGLDEVGDFIVRRIAVGHLVRTDLPLFATLATSATLPINASGPPSLRMKIQRALIG
jgi:hemerythrin